MNLRDALCQIVTKTFFPVKMFHYNNLSIALNSKVRKLWSLGIYNQSKCRICCSCPKLHAKFY